MLYDSEHQGTTIRNWIKYGIKSDNYKKLYDYHMNINKCELCNINFNDTIKYQRCLDHDHITGLYRKTLCRSCNATYMKAPQKLKITNKLGHMWINIHKTKNKSGNYSFGFCYGRKLNNNKRKRKLVNSLTKVLRRSIVCQNSRFVE